MQVFFGFLWNRHLSLQNFRLYSSSFFSLSCWNKDFSPFTWVSDTSAVGLQRRNGCRMLAVVKLFKRTFRGPSLNWLPERKCPMKSICVLRSLTHRAFSKRGGRHSSFILHEHPASPGVTPWPVCLCWGTIPSPHSQRFSPGRCGCTVLTGSLPSCAGVTFITLHCGSCSTFYKYHKVHCMGELKLGLFSSDMKSRNSCFELEPWSAATGCNGWNSPSQFCTQVVFEV